MTLTSQSGQITATGAAGIELTATHGDVVLESTGATGDVKLIGAMKVEIDSTDGNVEVTAADKLELDGGSVEIKGRDNVELSSSAGDIGISATTGQVTMNGGAGISFDSVDSDIRMTAANAVRLSAALSPETCTATDEAACASIVLDGNPATCTGTAADCQHTPADMVNDVQESCVATHQHACDLVQVDGSAATCTGAAGGGVCTHTPADGGEVDIQGASGVTVATEDSGITLSTHGAGSELTVTGEGGISLESGGNLGVSAYRQASLSATHVLVGASATAAVSASGGTCVDSTGAVVWTPAVGTCVDDTGAEVQAATQALCEDGTTNTWRHSLSQASCEATPGNQWTVSAGTCLDNTGALVPDVTSEADCTAANSDNFWAEAGDVDIQASNDVTISGGTAVTVTAAEVAVNAGANLNIRAETQLNLHGRDRVELKTESTDPAKGNIVVDASNSFIMEAGTGAVTIEGHGVDGDGNGVKLASDSGDITIESANLLDIVGNTGVHVASTTGGISMTGQTDVSLAAGQRASIVGTDSVAVTSGAGTVSIHARGGTCLSQDVDQTSCESSGYTWFEESPCSLGGAGDTCYRCATFTGTQAACEAATNTWVPATGGTCWDSTGAVVDAYTDQALCEGNSHIWTGVGVVDIHGGSGLNLNSATGSDIRFASGGSMSLESLASDVVIAGDTGVSLRSLGANVDVVAAEDINIEATTATITAADSLTIETTGQCWNGATLVPDLMTADTCEYASTGYTWDAVDSVCRTSNGDLVVDPARTSAQTCEFDPSGYSWDGGDVTIAASGDGAGDGQLTMTATQAVELESTAADVSVTAATTLSMSAETVQAVGTAHVSLASTEGSVAITAANKVSLIGAGGTCMDTDDNFVEAFSQALCEDGTTNTWTPAVGTCIDDTGAAVQAATQAL